MKFFAGLKKYNEELGKIAAFYQLPTAAIVADCLICRLFHGADVAQYIGFSMYKMKNRERKQYVTALRSAKIEKELNTGSEADKAVIGDKRIFNETFSRFVKRKWIYAPEATADEIRIFLEQNQIVLVKPLSNSKGIGVRKLKFSEIKELPSGIENFIKDAQRNNLLIESVIRQHPLLAAVNPSSVNTVRICSVRDKTGEVHIIGASLRGGGEGSVVDNLHAGGVQYSVDVETGIIQRGGVTFDGEKNILFHPSSHMKMIGFQIPNWDDVLRSVKEAGKIPANIRYLGWDLAITEDGCEIIEANYGQGSNGMQQDGVGKYRTIMQYR